MYGIAFLMALIVISSLWYFGVLSPEQLTPDKCVASTGFYCLETLAIASQNNISIRLANSPRFLGLLLH